MSTANDETTNQDDKPVMVRDDGACCEEDLEYSPSTTSHQQQQDAPAWTDLEKKIMALKVVPVISFLCMTIIVSAATLRPEYDQFAWMKYQTLLTPPDYCDYIWLPIFFLHGLYVYTTFTTNITTLPAHAKWTDFQTLRSSITMAMVYLIICLGTILSVVSYKDSKDGFALLNGLVCVTLLTMVAKNQREVFEEIEDEEEVVKVEKAAEQQVGVAGSYSYIPAPIMQYASHRLPFELHAGHALALVAVYLCAFVGSFDISSSIYLIVANTSLASLVVLGFALLWKVQAYGAGVALIWYLIGVAVELRAPTQPVYNSFSDAVILSTQIVAGMGATALSTLVGIRLVKTAIKRNWLGRMMEKIHCGKKEEEEIEDGGISTGYVHA